MCTYNGIMIPSYAHDEEILKRTLLIVSKALQCVAEAESKDDFESRLEIPNIIEFQ